LLLECKPSQKDKDSHFNCQYKEVKAKIGEGEHL